MKQERKADRAGQYTWKTAPLELNAVELKLLRSKLDNLENEISIIHQFIEEYREKPTAKLQELVDQFWESVSLDFLSEGENVLSVSETMVLLNFYRCYQNYRARAINEAYWELDSESLLLAIQRTCKARRIHSEKYDLEIPKSAFKNSDMFSR